MSPTENDLRDLLLRESSDIGELPTLRLTPTSRRPYLPVAAAVATVLTITGAGAVLARHVTGGHGPQTGGSPSAQFGGNPKDGIGPSGTACIRSAGSVPPLDPTQVGTGVAIYHGTVGKPVTITATAPDPLDNTVTAIRIGVTGPGTPTGDCALATTSKVVASGHLHADMRLFYTFTPWEPGAYGIGLQTEPEVASSATSPNIPAVNNPSDGDVTGALVGLVEVS